MASILLMPSQIELYEEIRQLSSCMVEAAQSNEWDQLINLEHSVAALRDTLMTTSADENLTSEEIARKRWLIQRILEDDAEVRRHTEPWMEQVRQFLGDNNRRRDMQKAYAAGAGDASYGV
jgi:flagellar protein FliT